MSAAKEHLRKGLTGLLLGLAAALLVLGVNRLLASSSSNGVSLLGTFEAKTYDWRMQRTARPQTARQDLALVEIDEYSLQNLEPNVGRWPWPRAVHSMIVDFLARAPARAIAYDVLFTEADTRTGFDFGGTTWSGRESDDALAESVRRAGNVIVLVNAVYEGEAVGAARPLRTFGFRPESDGAVEREVVFPPYDALADAAAGFAHNLLVLDPDGPVRHTIPFVRSGGVMLPSFGVATAARLAGVDPSAITLAADGLHFGAATQPLEWHEARSADGVGRYQWALVNYRGGALLNDLKSRPYAHYSAFDVLNAENQIINGEKPAIDPAVFRDKVVFVGVTAQGLADVFQTPFAGARMPGIQLHAAVADDLLSRRFMAPLSRWTTVLTVLALALASGAIAASVAAWWAALSVLLLLALFVWTLLLVFEKGVWIEITQPALASSLALFGGVAYQYLVEGREKRKVKRLFGQYVSKDIFEQIVSHPERARLGGERREMTVLFSDIRGFTSLTERGEPEETVRMLNEYFTRMVDIVFAHRGTLDKFVGDMVMALFGAPLDDPEHAEHAVQAAVAMADELARLNEKWKAEGRFAGLDIGIGINTGPMIAGNIGSEAVMSYTVIGDAVNLGSRLESLNKQYGTRIIISDATRQQLSGRYDLRPLGDVVVKGKTKPVAIFEVRGWLNEAGSAARKAGTSNEADT